jgi:predicted AAA+ superfamily ATPase
MNKIERFRQAQRSGWHVVKAVPDPEENKHWKDIVDWCETNINGYYVYSYSLGKFAFEQGKDATWFRIKWC